MSTVYNLKSNLKKVKILLILLKSRIDLQWNVYELLYVSMVVSNILLVKDSNN